MSQMSFDVDFPKFIINPCSGEPILFFGDIQGFIHDVSDEKGKHHILHLNLDKIRGTGRITGEIYRPGNTDSAIDIFGLEKPGIEVVKVSFNITGQGKVPNFTVYFSLRLKLLENDELTGEIISINARCTRKDLLRL